MNETILKECKKHGLTEFVRRTDGVFCCKKCRVDAVQRRREKIKELAVEYKGGKCEKCGYDKCIDALEFHHLEPSEKDFSLSEKGYTRSREKVKKELDKCILVCANCHRELHYKEKKHIGYINERKKVDKIDENLVLELTKQNLTQKEIAEKLNVSVSTIKRVLKKIRGGIV